MLLSIYSLRHFFISEFSALFTSLHFVVCTESAKSKALQSFQ